MKDAEPLGPSRALARAYSALDGGYLELGQPEHAVHEVKALEIYRELGAARWAAVIESNLGVQAYAEGRWRDATAYYTRSREELERLGDATQAAFASANLGEVLVTRSLLDEAATELEDAQRTLRAAEHVTGAIFAETQLARLALRRGEVDAAIEASHARGGGRGARQRLVRLEACDLHLAGVVRRARQCAAWRSTR